MGRLIPFLQLEAIPGDQFSISCESLSRFAALLSPVMHRVKLQFHFFYTPHRLVWGDFDDFIADPENTMTAPYFSTLSGLGATSLGNYMGIPSSITDDNILVGAMPLATYALIYDEWYMDDDLGTPLFTELVAGNNDAVGTYSTTIAAGPARRNWARDYFGACMAAPQRGTAVKIPSDINGPTGLGISWDVRNTSTDALTSGDVTAAGSPLGRLEAAGQGVYLDPKGALVNDSTIEDLRTARTLQKYYEMINVSGTRINEWIRMQFGVNSGDVRAGKPEYIGGYTANMRISEVLSTAETLDSLDAVSNPVGSLQGHGLSAGSSPVFRKFCPEHGFIHGICSVVPEPSYMQSLHKMYDRLDNLNYALPIFANLGEQEVKVRELWANGTITEADEVFGYLPRYTEYKTHPNMVTGEFRTTLEYWHLARKFASKPTLSAEFLGIDKDDLDRIFAVQTGHSVYSHIYNNVNVRRYLPYIVNAIL